MVIGMQRLEIYSASPFIHDGAVKAAWGGAVQFYRKWKEKTDMARKLGIGHDDFAVVRESNNFYPGVVGIQWQGNPDYPSQKIWEDP